MEKQTMIKEIIKCKKYILFGDENTTREDKIFNLSCKNKHNQLCPMCFRKLNTITNYVGGGSHYWHLQCPLCHTEYYYDTYRFKLEEVNDNK